VPPIMHTQHLSFVRSIGRNIKHLIDRPDEDYCFRLHKDRVYYVSEAVMRKATCVNRKQLMSVGTCFGKFTKTLKFRLHITALDYISQYAKYKVWVKPSSELSYLYGNNVLKAGLGRITENTPQYQVMNLRLELEIITTLNAGLGRASRRIPRSTRSAHVYIINVHCKHHSQNLDPKSGDDFITFLMQNPVPESLDPES
jgi:ribosome biogenesis protein Nip4